MQEYGLIDNPFLPDSYSFPMAGRKKEWEQIIERINKASSESGSKTLLLIGDYGMGKTFTLQQIDNNIHEKKSDFKHEKNIVVLIKVAESEPQSKFGFSFVTKIFFTIGKKQLYDIAKDIDEKEIADFDSDFKKIISMLSMKEESAYNWLIGEADSTDIKSLGVKKKMKTSAEAIEILYNFLRAIKIAKYKNIIVLIDEFEYVVNLYGDNKITQMLHTFKEIIDEYPRTNTKKPGSTSNFIFFIAMTPESWQHLTDLEATMKKKTGGGGITPWMERINTAQDIIRLEPLDKKATGELIKDRLEKKRAEYKKDSKDEMFPFVTPGFVDFIFKESHGVPRKIIAWCEIVLTDSIKQGLKEISEKDADKILTKYHLIFAF
ncbi:MAG: BREX system ATP-binding domain-containing protein [Candidatus Micrarchaeia archaeon]